MNGKDVKKAINEFMKYRQKSMEEVEGTTQQDQQAGGAEELVQQAPAPEQAPAETAAPEQTRLQELEQQAAAYKDMLLRKAAEMENLKRRTENDLAQTIKFANERLLAEILPLVDDFERSLKAGREQHDFDSFYKGVELIYQKLMKKLDEQGVKPMETAGKPFDVHFHDALMQVATADAPPDTVLNEVEKGFLYHGKVIRHAKVIVSAAPAEAAGTQAAEGAANGK